MLLALIGLAAVLAWLWAPGHSRPVTDAEIRRLRRAAESMHREQALPFD